MILEPSQLSPSLMRHACLAAIGYIEGQSILDKAGIFATLRDAVTTPAATVERDRIIDVLSEHKQKLVSELNYQQAAAIRDAIDLIKKTEPT